MVKFLNIGASYKKKKGHKKIYSYTKYEDFITDTVFSYAKEMCLDNQAPRDLSPEVKQPEHEAEFRDG